jgi:long-chain fatty acid transport protein
MQRQRNLTLAIGAAIAVAAAAPAFATNGYFTHGTGTKNKSMAGAGIALPEDSIDTVNNPAVAALVGENLQLGLAVFSPKRSYRTTESLANGQGGAFTIGPNNIESDSEYFFIPHFSKSWNKGNGFGIALSVYGRGGMNTDWKGGTATFDPDGPGPAPVTTFPGTYGAGNAGVNLSQAFLDLAFAWQINDRLSLGVSPMLAYQMFEAEGVLSFAGFTRTFAASGGAEFPSRLSNNGTDNSWGYGLKLGLHTDFTDSLSLGVMYQTKLWMTELDDYADLFAEQGDFDIPANLKIGLTWKSSDTLAWSFDIEHTWFSDVDSVGNPIALIAGCPTAGFGGTNLENCLGGNSGAGFGWDDMTTYKLGVRWIANADWTWRFGYSYGEQPIPNTEMTFNILAPAVVEHHLTAGFTRALASGNEWNLSFMYAPKSDQTGPQNFDPTQNVTWEMDQWEVEFSYSWR